MSATFTPLYATAPPAAQPEATAYPGAQYPAGNTPCGCTGSRVVSTYAVLMSVLIAAFYIVLIIALLKFIRS